MSLKQSPFDGGLAQDGDALINGDWQMRDLFFRYRNPVLSAALIAACLATATTARSANAISRAIERAQPCRSVKLRKFGVTIGIDNFKSADLESLKVDVTGDSATISLVGSLACRTSDDAAVRGDASARFSAAADIDLASCAVSRNTVQILSTGGSFGAAVAAFKSEIETAVAASFVDAAKNLCK